MTPAEDIALLEQIRDRAAVVAPRLAMAMGNAQQRELKDHTLARTAHAPVTQTPAPEGGPPAMMTGALRASVTCIQGPGGGTSGSSIVAPHTIYAATQEWGAEGREVHPNMYLWLKYIGREEVVRRGWKKHVVNIPPRPYMGPSLRDVLADGSAVRDANAIFIAFVLSGLV